MHYDMVFQVVSAQGCLLKPLCRIVGQFRPRLPCTLNVIKLSCLLKELSSFVLHAFHLVRFPLRPDELGDHRR
jgi:hypothetical protein